jgi:hypothetical protein
LNRLPPDLALAQLTQTRRFADISALSLPKSGAFVLEFVLE